MTLLRSFGTAIHVLQVALLVGCVHLHSDQDAKLAKDTAAKFDEYRKPGNSLYDTMLANQRQVVSRNNEFRAQLIQLRTNAFLNQLHTLNWQNIQNGLTKAKANQEAANAKVTADLKELLKQQGVAETEVGDAKKVLAKARELVAKASEEELRWKARKLLLQSAIVLIVEKGKLDSESFEAIKNRVLNEEIPGEKGKDGKPMKLKDVVGKDTVNLDQKSLTEVLKGYTFQVFDPSAQPGVTVTILSLSSDLAEAQLRRAKAEKDYLGQQVKFLTPAVKRADAIDEALTRLQESFDEPIQRFKFDPSSTPLRTINLYQKPFTAHDDEARRANAIRVSLAIVAAYAISQTLDDPGVNSLDLGARLAALNHEHSIRTSAVNAAEQEALVGRGLQALAIYHEGGITSEEIGNLIRAAQTAALAWIGAGVN